MIGDRPTPLQEQLDQSRKEYWRTSEEIERLNRIKNVRREQVPQEIKQDQLSKLLNERRKHKVDYKPIKTAAERRARLDSIGGDIKQAVDNLIANREEDKVPDTSDISMALIALKDGAALTDYQMDILADHFAKQAKRRDALAEPWTRAEGRYVHTTASKLFVMHCRILDELADLGAWLYHPKLPNPNKRCSYYIKFADKRIRTLRISDHPGKREYSYKWNLILNGRNEERQDGSIKRFFYSFGRTHDLCNHIRAYYKAILRNNAEEMMSKSYSEIEETLHDTRPTVYHLPL